MRRLYFSHSYRDEEINEYFLELFAEQAIELVADKKSKTWCVPKLERYMKALDGLVTVLPRRKTEDGGLTFSPYITFELQTARRAGLPHLLFVDDALLPRHPNAFRGCMPFRRNAPRSDENEHRQAIAEFCAKLEAAGPRRPMPGRLRECTVFLGPNAARMGLSAKLAEVLREKEYLPHIVDPKDFANCRDDLSALESLWPSEFAVFCLEGSLSPVDVALAQAHALCKPAFRLCHDADAVNTDSSPSGVVRWRDVDELLSSLRQQLESYGSGFLEAVMRQRAPRALARELDWRQWELRDPLALVQYIEVEDPHLRDDLHAIRMGFGQGFADIVKESRLDELCQATYQRILAHDWLYDFEPGSKDYSWQRIRTPREMHADRVGTCLDFACLFAALMDNMKANPVVACVGGPGWAHALAGCWKTNRAVKPIVRDQQVVRRALEHGDLFLFETTGAARATQSVAGETRSEKGTLTFAQARASADRLLARADVSIYFLLDVDAAR